jgi:hypothetical protein
VEGELEEETNSLVVAVVDSCSTTETLLCLEHMQ